MPCLFVLLDSYFKTDHKNPFILEEASYKVWHYKEQTDAARSSRPLNIKYIKVQQYNVIFSMYDKVFHAEVSVLNRHAKITLSAERGTIIHHSGVS